MRIDAHQHFWALSRRDYRWLTPDLAPIYRDFGPLELAPLLASAQIERTVLVQATDTVAETYFLFSVANQTPFVAGVVGWADLEARNATKELEKLARDGKLVGVRPMIQDMADAAWMLRPSLGPALRAIGALDLAFDALVKVVHLPHLRSFLARHPELRVVIDHGAKPTVACGMRPWPVFATWRDHLAAIARESTAFCKLSGLVTETEGEWTTADLRPYVDVLLETFGPRRLMWGSDWPMVNLARGFEAWWNATGELLSGLSAEEREAVLGGNAARFYRLREAGGA